jgi:hypothetical protein
MVELGDLDWREVTLDFASLGPFERLQLLTRLGNEVPSEVPWLAVVLPVETGAEYVEVNVSLAGALRFGAAARSGLAALGNELRDRCTTDEINWILGAQERRGNLAQISTVGESTFALIVPRRLMEEAKSRVASVFGGVPGVVEPSGDADY